MVNAKPVLYGNPTRESVWSSMDGGSGFIAYLQWYMPSTPRQPQYHPYREEEAPYDSLQEHMNPQDSIHRRIRILVRNILVVFVRKRRCRNQTKQKHKEDVPQLGHSRPVRRRHCTTVSLEGGKQAPTTGEGPARISQLLRSGAHGSIARSLTASRDPPRLLGEIQGEIDQIF